MHLESYEGKANKSEWVGRVGVRPRARSRTHKVQPSKQRNNNLIKSKEGMIVFLKCPRCSLFDYLFRGVKSR